MVEALPMPLMPARTAIALLAGILVASDASAQFARVAPPAACVVPAAERWPLLPAELEEKAARASPALAILTFERGASVSEREHWAWSLPDRLWRRLSASRSIIVRTPGTVARAISEAGGGLDSAIALLRVQYVLSGRVDDDGRQGQVSVELRRVGVRAPIWRAEYRTTMTFRAVEDAMAAEIGRRLAASAPVPEVVDYPGNDAAYDALVAGEYHSLSPTVAGADSAVRSFERALAAAPASPLVAARLARAFATAAERSGAPLAGSASADRLPGLLERALARDSSVSAVWTARAVLARVTDPVGFGRSALYHRRALALAPDDADALHEQGLTRLRLGDLSGAAEYFRRALRHEPNRAPSIAALAEIAVAGERWTAACAAANAAIAARPFDAWPYALRAQARMRLGQSRDAFADAEIANRLARAAWSAAFRVVVSQRAGDVDLARRSLQQESSGWLSAGRTFPVRDAEFVARAYVAVGDRRRAVEALRRAQPVGTDLLRTLGHADFAALRADTAVVRLRRQGSATASRPPQRGATARPQVAVPPAAPPDSTAGS